MNDKKWFQSSSGSGNLSMTIAGLSVAGIPAFLSRILDWLGVSIPENDLANFVNVTIQFAGSVMTIYGLLKKFYFAWRARRT